MITEAERFDAVSDAGERYTIVKLQRWVEVSLINGATSKAEGSFEWKTACGIDLQDNGDGSFEMIQIDGTLRRL